MLFYDCFTAQECAKAYAGVKNKNDQRADKNKIQV
jgi:hypothetical protein